MYISTISPFIWQIRSLAPVRENGYYKGLVELEASHNQIESMDDLIGSPFVKNRPVTLNLQFNNLTRVLTANPLNGCILFVREGECDCTLFPPSCNSVSDYYSWNDIEDRMHYVAVQFGGPGQQFAQRSGLLQLLFQRKQMGLPLWHPQPNSGELFSSFSAIVTKSTVFPRIWVRT